MKKLLLFAALLFSVSAMADFTTTLADASWNFNSNEGTGTRPSLTNASFVIPENCVTGTGGSSNATTAYVAYIFPNVLSTSKPDAGYDGRYCLYMMHPANTSRTPNFFMLPTVTDAAYDTLALHFYAKSDNADHSQELMIGYITSLADTAKANFASAYTALDTVTLSPTAYQEYTVSLNGAPTGAYIVLYNNDATKIFYMYVDNISFQAAQGGTTPATPTAPSITYNLTGCTGDSDNPATWDNTTGTAEITLSLSDGFEWGTPEITIDGVAVANMMTDYSADPAYYIDIDDDEATIYIYYMDGDVETGVVVTMTCNVPAAPAVTPIPGAATFEEYATVLAAAGSKYNPWEADGTHYWQSGDYTFSCTRSYGGMMNDGFYAANWHDTTYTGYADDYKAITAAAQEGSCYASLYYGGSWGGPCKITCSERTITGTYVTLALNPYLCIKGKSWSAAFANGDYLYLHLSGKKNGVYTGTSADFYLADYREGKTELATTWQWFDLTGLGQVDEVEVVIYDSQSGAGVGLYACFDNFGGVAPSAPTAVSNIEETIITEKLILNGQVVIRRGEHIFNVAGQLIR